MDIAFDNLAEKITNGKLDGVIGQFYGKGLHLTKSDDGERAVLRVG